MKKKVFSLLLCLAVMFALTLMASAANCTIADFNATGNGLVFACDTAAKTVIVALYAEEGQMLSARVESTESGRVLFDEPTDGGICKVFVLDENGLPLMPCYTYRGDSGEGGSSGGNTGEEAVNILTYSLLSDGTCGVVAGEDAATETDIVIPSTYAGVAVTQILAGGFKDLTVLQAITIPNSITTINPNAFRGCGSLKSVSIPKSVSLIGAYAFYGSGVNSVTLEDNTGWRIESYSVPLAAPGVIFDRLSFDNYKRGNWGTNYSEEYTAKLDLTKPGIVAKALTATTTLTVVRTYKQIFPATGYTNVQTSNFGSAYANFYTENWIKS